MSDLKKKKVKLIAFDFSLNYIQAIKDYSVSAEGKNTAHKYAIKETFLDEDFVS